MRNQFTLHCIAWEAGAPLLEEVCAAAVKIGLISLSEAQPDESDKRCRHALAISKDGHAIGCARITPEGKIERVVVLTHEQRSQIEAALNEALLDYAHEQVSVNGDKAKNLRNRQSVRLAA